MSASYSYIAIEGPIGVGKTSLASKLAEDFTARLLLEQANANPFLEKFYQNPQELGLPTQLYFLTNRTRQLQLLRQEDIFSRVSISDFLIQKDRLFAEMILNEEQYRLYNYIYENLVADLVKPDLVIYLQAPVEVLMQRIQMRGIHFEKLIEKTYLEKLNAAYLDFFFNYQDSLLLIINVGQIDFVDDEDDYYQLVRRVRLMLDSNVRAGRYYYNPVPYRLSQVSLP